MIKEPKLFDHSDNSLLISIIINCYNGESFLNQALDSVLKQTYREWEVIFWDNLSTDKSEEIFKCYKNKKFHYFKSKTHTKLGEARNLAVERAEGNWVAFLDCDDVWLPNKLEQQVKIIRSESTNLGLVYSKSQVFLDKNVYSSNWGNRLIKRKNKEVLKKLPEGQVLSKLLRFNFISMSTALVKKELYFKVGGISTYLQQAEDYELFIKIAEISQVRAAQEVLTLYRVHDKNNSIGNEQLGFDETVKIINRMKKTNMTSSALHYHYASYGMQKLARYQIIKGLIYFIDLRRIIPSINIIKRKIFKKI